MFWTGFFGQNNEDYRDAWGYKFQWTTEHLSQDEMHPLRYSYDKLAEDCLDRLDAISPPQDPRLPRNKNATSEKEGNHPKRDLYTLLRDHASEDTKLHELWTEVTSVPEWVDWEQIERGQDVFYRYGGMALTALAYQSLIGGMGSGRVVEVLARTGGFRVEKSRQRIYETTQHILQVTKSIESIKPGGDGHISSIRVRLLHAAVRRRILKLARERPGYYNVEAFGVPINDLDSIGTISTFSAALIWVGLPRQGINMRPQEILDFLSLWKYVSYLVGSPIEYFTTPSKAKAVMESLMYSEINPSEMSCVLANNVILGLAGRPPAYASKEFLSASARWLNGPELSDALGLMKPSFYYTVLMAGQCVFFNVFVRINRAVDSWDRQKIKALKRIFWTVIVDQKLNGLGQETVFDFKYIPDFHVTTEKDEHYEGGDKSYSVERRNLRTIAFTSVVIGAISWLGIKAARWGIGLALGYSKAS